LKELSLEKQIYLCKYHEIDNCLHLGITAKERDEILTKLKQNGLYEQYRKLEEDEYENIIKNEKSKDKYEKILEKYKFDKTSKGYNNLKQVLVMCNKYNTTEFSMERIYKQVAAGENVENYIIRNDCQRLLDNTYQLNKEIFEQNEYHRKPSVKEFMCRELSIESTNTKNEEINVKVEEKNEESTEKSTETNINTQFIADIDNTYVKVPVKIIAEWAYQKRIFR